MRDLLDIVVWTDTGCVKGIFGCCSLASKLGGLYVINEPVYFAWEVKQASHLYYLHLYTFASYRP